MTRLLGKKVSSLGHDVTGSGRFELLVVADHDEVAALGGDGDQSVCLQNLE